MPMRFVRTEQVLARAQAPLCAAGAGARDQVPKITATEARLPAVKHARA